MSNKSYIPTMTISTKVSPDIGFTDEQVNQCDVPVVIIKKNCRWLEVIKIVDK